MDPRELLGATLAPWTPIDIGGCPLGHVVGASCPGEPPSTIVSVLHPEERSYSAPLAPARLREWISGRICLAAAVAKCGSPLLAMVSAANGRPRTPLGVVGSLSHKGSVAVAVAALNATNGVRQLGVDLEYPRTSDTKLADRVLTPNEHERGANLSGLALTRFVTLHYAVKEAAYKCADDHEQVDLDFQAIDVGAVPPEGSRNWFSTVAVLNGSQEMRVAVLQRASWIVAVAAQ